MRGMIMYPLLWIIMTVTKIISCCGRETNFLKKPMCLLNEEKCPGASRNTGRLTSAIDCAKNCIEDGQCLGFSQRGQTMPKDIGLCFLHYDCLSWDPVCDNETDYFYYEREITTCENGGVFRKEQRSCDCSNTGGWVGRVCSSAPRTCLDLITWGYSTGFKRILKSTVSTMEIEILTCYTDDKSGKISTYILDYGDTNSNLLNRSWADFEDGFYANGVSWMGLKHIKAMLDILKDKSPTLAIRFLGNTIVQYDYTDFQLGDATTFYNISFGTCKKYLSSSTEEHAKLPDCLGDLQGVQFSTFDRDNDHVSSENCALISKSGFWYGTTCIPLCNPFGVSFDSNPPQPFSIGTSASDTTVWAGQFGNAFLMILIG